MFKVWCVHVVTIVELVLVWLGVRCLVWGGMVRFALQPDTT